MCCCPRFAEKHRRFAETVMPFAAMSACQQLPLRHKRGLLMLGG